MAPGDKTLSRSTSQPSATEADTPAEHAAPRPTVSSTVLSTVWEGPASPGRADAVDGNRPAADLPANDQRSRVKRWLLAPMTHRRALAITAVAAVLCGGLLVVGGFDEPAPVQPSLAAGDPVSTQGSLRSRALATDDPAPEPMVRESVSADGRLRVTAESSPTDPGSWLLEAHPVDDTRPASTVRFTVNGAVVEDVDQRPYRLLLNPEILASLRITVDEAQPLVVTATAVWTVDTEPSSPATLVLSN